MGGREYIIHGGAAGRERLRLLARAMAPFTGTLFDDAGIAKGARVLDIGCGGGDVTQELGRRVGPAGRVLGVDMDAVEIEIARKEAAALGTKNVEYRAGNVLTDEIGEKFDAIYARFLLSHLAKPEQGLSRMVACLNPGGLIVVEDVDFSGHFCEPERASFTDYVRWYEQSARRRGVDSRIGPRLPAMLADAGLKVLGARAVNPAAISGPIKEIAFATLTAIADSVVESGVASREQVNAALADLALATADPRVFMSMPRVVQSWGRLG
jgi:SAM-dependent methyltransferase